MKFSLKTERRGDFQKEKDNIKKLNQWVAKSTNYKQTKR